MSAIPIRIVEVGPRDGLKAEMDSADGADGSGLSPNYQESGVPLFCPCAQ
jgi:hypothetical protein